MIEQLAREGLDIAWEMQEHRLVDATLKSRQAVHLGGKWVEGRQVRENLHGSAFVGMAAKLFGGSVPDADGGSTSATPTDFLQAVARGAKGGHRPPSATERATPKSGALPAAGQRVRAVLSDSRTKKGGWKAEVTVGDDRIVGDIFNSAEVPADVRPGLEVDLVVRVRNPRNASFEWPSPKVEARLAKGLPFRRAGSRKGRRN